MSSCLQFRKLPRDHTGCGWYDSLPAPPAPSTLAGDRTADWAVLGGGLTGLAAARRLAELRPEEQIALIEAQRIGFGASGRNSGFMIDLPHRLASESYVGRVEEDRRLIQCNRAAIAFMRRIVQTHAIACDWSEHGKIHAAASDRGANALAGFAQGLDALGEPYTLLSALDVARITGSAYYQSGIHTPGTVLVQPAALVRGLARTMPDNVTVYENSPITRLSPGRGISLQSAEGTLKATNLVLANNGFAAQFGFLRGRLIPVFTYASLTRSLTEREQERLGGDKTWGLIPADPLGTTVRRLRDQRLLIRNTFTHNPDFTSTTAQRQRIRARHKRSFQARFPTIADVGFDYTWGGVLSMSRNAAPYFGRLMPGVYAAVCQNGLGLAGGTSAGKLIAEYACQDDNELVRHMLASAQPVRNPPAPMTRLGVYGTILWKEWQAGNEI